MALLYSHLFEGMSAPPSNYLIYSGFRIHFTLDCVLSKYDKMEPEADFSSTNMCYGVYTY